jgi:saxitoxin biosynthesis operon SxtJ-like protein
MTERTQVAPLVAGDRWAGALAGPQEKAPSMRLFGIVLLVGFGLLGGLSLWSYRAGGAEWRLVVGWALIAIGSIVFLWSLISPASLPPVYHAWMRFGQGIGTVVSGILFSVLYFVVFFVIGRLMRLSGTDPLDRRIDRGAGSYWRKHAPRSTAADYAHMS